jgi:hypothetical protein
MPSRVTMWSLLIIAVALAITGGTLMMNRRPAIDRSIDVSERFGKVQNGSAFDRAHVDLGSAKKIVLPDDAVVRRIPQRGQLQLFMRKTLLYKGHPPKPMSIQDTRTNMGCAVKREHDTLVVATFGEWDSRKEGGVNMRLIVLIPQELEVEARNGLSGPDSAALAEGWTVVPDRPDPDRTAE